MNVGAKSFFMNVLGAACSVRCWFPRPESGESNKDAACKTVERGGVGGRGEGERMEAATEFLVP